MKKFTYSDALMTDPEVRTCIHDEIILWCYDNIRVIIDSLFKLKDFDITSIELEKPIISNNNVIGFLDMYVSMKHKEYPATENIIIEAKSKIGSLGELLRQIKFYNFHCHGKYIVVSPDIDDYINILTSQNIYSYKCPQPESTLNVF